jgi:membrane protein DedA with SNARE-associated domain
VNDLLAEIAQWAVDVVYSFGYVGVFVLIGLINLHLLPLPTQLILALAGFLVGQGRFSFVLVLLASTSGAVLASLVLYFLGFLVGEKNLYRLVKRIERFKIVFRSDLIRASKVFQRHGGKAILIGHLVPAVGAFISIPAGLTRMPLFGRFTFYTVLGSTLWNGVFIILGWVLGAQWTSVKQYTSTIEYVALTLLAGGVLWLLWRRWKALR